MELEKLFKKIYTYHLDLNERSPRNKSGTENWVQNMLNEQKLGNYLEVSNRTNQF